MTIDITFGTVSAALGVATAVGKVVHSLVNVALEKRDGRIAALEATNESKARELESAFRVVKDTQKTLFDKLDALTHDHQAYKLHVAETYIGEAKIEKLVAPILERLSRIEDDLRRERTRSAA